MHEIKIFTKGTRVKLEKTVNLWLKEMEKSSHFTIIKCQYGTTKGGYCEAFFLYSHRPNPQSPETCGLGDC